MGLINIKVSKPKLNTNFKGCIYVGVPKSKSNFTRGSKTKPRNEFTNADILAVLENGSPMKNIVPRPLLKATIKQHQRELNEALQKAIPIVLSGVDDEIDRYFETLALKIQGWVQMYMLREGQERWEPSLRVLRAKVRGEQAKTLIDTGSLRQSIIAFYSKSGNPD